jgi:AcrR family transcriptional regulator
MPKIVDHDERRDDYIAALWRLVTRVGAGGISVRGVAAEAGVSPSNIVHYLPTRADMLGVAVERLMADAMDTAAVIDTTDLDLDLAVDAVMAIIPDTPLRRRQSEVWLLLLAEQESSADARRILGVLQKTVRSGLRAGMDVLADHGMLHPDRDRDIEAERLHGLIDGLSLQTLVNSRVVPPRRIRVIVAHHLAELSSPLSSS